MRTSAVVTGLVFSAVQTVALLLAQAPVPMPSLGELRVFDDWAVGCDNTWRCMATSLYPEAGPGVGGPPVVIARESGPDGRIDVWVTVDEPGTLPVDFVVDGRTIATVAVQSGIASVRGDNARTLATAIARGRRLEVSRGAQIVCRPSLAGSSAALRYMDASQLRAGTTTALVASGIVGSYAVPAGPPMPVVSRVRPAATRTVMPEPLSRDEESRAFATADCGPASSPHREDTRLAALSAARTLVLVSCPSTGYNPSHAVLIATGAPGRRAFALAEFDHTPRSGAYGAAPIVANGGWDAERAELHSFFKARSLLDCGSSERYVWDGTMFRLVEARAMNVCRGGSEFIVLWRAGY
jgi:hypothetical protein